MADGYRESPESWAGLLRDCQWRGMRAPVLAVGDGALGFRNALNEVFPETRHQRRWVHNTANCLDSLPKPAQPAAKKAIQDIYNDEDREHAATVVKAFARQYGAKFPRPSRSLLRTRPSRRTPRSPRSLKPAYLPEKYPDPVWAWHGKIRFDLQGVEWMGLDYSYEIFTPAQNVTAALVELAALAPRTDRVPPLTLTLPGGDQVVVPFTSNFKSEPVDCSASSALELDTSIMFGVDDAVREYVDTVYDPEPDELGRVAIGYVYLTVRFASWLHPHYASLEFTAATTGMSRMFERSASVRAVFTDLTVASGGVCCALDTESDTLQICWLNGQPIQETVPGPRFASYRDLVATWPGQDR